MTDRLNRRGFLAASLATGGFVLVNPKALRAATGDVLRFGLSTYPPSFDMWAPTGTAAGTFKLMIHRGLLGYDDKGELTGELAETWGVDDAGVWTFKLRKATFHDGSPVTSADVKYTINQIAAPTSTAFYRSQMQSITKIDTPDDMTVKLTTEKPTATIPVWFAHYHMPILKKGSEKTSTNGAGPFRFVSSERGQKITVEAYENYFRPGVPMVKGIDAIVYRDENLRVAALESGDVDIIEYVPWAAMDRVAKNPKLYLETVPGPFMYLTFNGSKPPFDDPLVRQAVAIAIKRTDVVDAAFYGHGAPLNHLPIDKSSPFYNADLADSWAFDMAKAKALLAKAGHAKGFDCTMLSTAQYGMHQQTAEVSQAYLAGIGINVKLDLPDWSTRVEKGNKGEYDITVMGSTADSNDPDGLSTILDGSLGPSFSRSYKLPTPEITKLLQQGRETFDLDKRKKIYHELEVQVMKIVPAVFLCSRSQGYGLADNVKGFSNLPGQLTFYSGLSLANTSLG